MEVNVVQGDIAQQQTDCIVVNLFEGVTEPGGATGAVDRALEGAIRSLVSSGDFTGEAGSTALLYTNGRLPAARVLVVGLGGRDAFDLHAARKAAAAALRAVAKLKGVSRFAT
ncbi:MAG: leucyl aminopeptidase, partial [Chloroflexi bacterium]